MIAIDNSPVRLALARHNAIIYGVQDRIEFILADFPSWAKSLQSTQASKVLTSLGMESGASSAPRAPAIPKIDVVFLSPPWGGPSYLSASSSMKPSAAPPTTDVVADVGNDESNPHPLFTLDMVAPLPGDELFALARDITPHVAYYLPRNTDVLEVSKLLNSTASPDEKIEIEEEWMGSKLKALTCYFGGLVKGQERLWTS